MRTRFVVLLSALLVLTSTLGMSADVKSQQKTQLKMEGMLGSVAGMFGGKAMKEGSITTIALKGNRRMSTTDTTGELIDLDAEKVYRLDLRGKTYTVKTFEELRREFQKSTARAEGASEKSDSKQPEMEVDFDVKKTGQQKSIAGVSCAQVIMTVTVREKGKTVDDGGGMVLTSDMWMAPRNPALQENLEFQTKYVQKLYGDQVAETARDMAQAMAMYPGMKPAMDRMQKEGHNLEGTPMLTTVTVSGAGGSDAKAGQERGGAGGLGGLGGLLGRKKKAEPAAEGTAGGAGAKTRATLLTTVTEVLSIETTVAAGEVEIPAGFKQK